MSATKVLNNISKSAPKLYKDFVKTFSANLQKEDFKNHKADTLLSMFSDIWALSKTRNNNEIHVQAKSIEGDKKGWLYEKTRIYVTSPDRAFIIDSVVAELSRRGMGITTLLHPVLCVKRDNKGKLTQVKPRNDKVSGENESWIVLETQGSLGPNQCRDLEQSLMQVMQDVMMATGDWQAMRGELNGCIADVQNYCQHNKKCDLEELQEYIAFLQYLHDGNFTLLGYREYDFIQKKKDISSKIIKGSSLGLLSDERRRVYINAVDASLPQDLQRLRLSLDAVSVCKVNRKSTVHRPVPMDAVVIKTFNKDGSIKGEKIFVGLFTSVTYSRSVADVPLIRQKIKRVFEMIDFAPNSHDYRALGHILEKYPRGELFQMPVTQIHDHVVGILRLQDRPHVALYPRVDPFRRYVSCLVYVPRDRYETKLRVTIQTILEQELGGQCEDFYTTLDDSPLARVTYVIETNAQTKRDYDFDAIEQKMREASRTWVENLSAALMESNEDEHRAIELAMRYDTAFPVAYQDYFLPTQAVNDIDFIEAAFAENTVKVNLYRNEHDAKGRLRLKIYRPCQAVILSDVLPVLENMGFRVESEFPFEITPDEGTKNLWLHEFYLNLDGHQLAADIEELKELIEDVFLALWSGAAENDYLNALVVLAGIDWRDVRILRAYTKYMQQASQPFSPAYVMQALTRYPVLSAALVGYFHACNDPAIPDSKRHLKDWKKAIKEGLESVKSLDEDRILRFILRLIDCTLRTNFYQRLDDGSPKTWLSIKLNSAKIEGLPEPKPWVEVFVFSPRMEGVHLRGGKIARGGIRWSDRQEDFRTEILDLMQAQMVKNAVIVPQGAKGGFVLKKLADNASREETLNEGIECYKLLMRGLLDITDNRVGNKIIPPKDVVCHDEPDPYLVVAADKGTASFSDIANGISAEYEFWLADAFASGGSAGYDHKKMGITARGAWESIKRHFHEMGHDTQKQPFDVIGVGDMGGDVFGNGMLLSKQIRLVGAFNHRHIFCDPNPDPATTWKERDKLFKNVQGWDGYDKKKLSKGGRIYDRSDKSLQLTKEIKDRFGIEDDEISPIDLMRVMLGASCDLLYFGGIGTYIKGVNQHHNDAGDRANNGIRLNSDEINARVIGEGANLGITRVARVELGKRGIRMNADFVDNSGGVDCSDHEVNIKILLKDMMSSKDSKMNSAARNALLEEMTDEVGALVLRNNYQQAQAISMVQMDAVDQLTTHARFIERLEAEDGLNRVVQGLPSVIEIERRKQARTGLTRPEIATIISLAKIKIYQGLLECDLPDDPLAEDWLFHYFPVPIRKNYTEAIQKHRLRREITANQMTASIVNRLGPTFIMTLGDKTGAPMSDIVRACFLAREAFGLRELWYGIEALDGVVRADVQLKSMREIAKLINYLTHWFIKHGPEFLEGGSLAEISDHLKVCNRTLTSNLEKLLPDTRIDRIKNHMQSAQSCGISESLSRSLAYLHPLRSAPDIIRLSQQDKKQIPVTAKIFFHLGEELHFDWLRGQARLMSDTSFWRAEVIDGLIHQLYATQATLTHQILETSDRKLGAVKRLHAWEDEQKSRLKQLNTLLSDMRDLPQMDLPMLTLAEQRLRQLCED